MTTVRKEKVARRKLSLLQLSQELGNVSKTCKLIGYNQQQFYEIRRTFQLYGADGLVDRLPGPKGPHPNRVSQEIEDAILAYRRPAGRSTLPASDDPRACEPKGVPRRP